MLIPFAYLGPGLAAGVIMLKWPGSRNESPVGTLLYTMVGWPIFAALLLLMGVLAAIGFGLSLIGVEAHQSDSHGC